MQSAIHCVTYIISIFHNWCFLSQLLKINVSQIFYLTAPQNGFLVYSLGISNKEVCKGLLNELWKFNAPYASKICESVLFYIDESFQSSNAVKKMAPLHI